MGFKKINLYLIVVTACLLVFIISLKGIISLNFDWNYKVIAQVFVAIILLLFLILFKKKIFEPYLFIPFVTLFYGFFGGINFIKRGAYVDYYNEIYFMLFVFCIMLCYCLLSMTTVQKDNSVSIKRIFTPKSSHLILNGLILAGLLSILIDWIQIGGIPLLVSSDMRMQSKPLFRLFFIVSIFFAYYKTILKPKKRNNLVLAVFVLLAVLSGYRTSIFFILIILFFKATKKQYFITHFKKIILVFVLLFFSVNLLKLYRDVSKYGIDHYYYIMDKEELPRSYFYVSPILHTVNEGPQIFQQIRDKLGNDFGNGSFFVEHVSTILPGKQRNYGQIYNNITKAVTDKTKTGTILSPFYIDFGVVGIILLGVILGCINYYLELKGRYSKYHNLLFMFFVSFEITWIHGGAPFSPTFLLALLMFVFLIPIFNRLK